MGFVYGGMKAIDDSKGNRGITIGMAQAVLRAYKQLQADKPNIRLDPICAAHYLDVMINFTYQGAAYLEWLGIIRVKEFGINRWHEINRDALETDWSYEVWDEYVHAWENSVNLRPTPRK